MTEQTVLRDQSALLSVTMSAKAAEQFKAALFHACVRIKDEEHAEWLRWGASRVTVAERDAVK